MVHPVILFLYDKGEKVNIEPHLPVQAQNYPGQACARDTNERTLGVAREGGCPRHGVEKTDHCVPL